MLPGKKDRSNHHLRVSSQLFSDQTKEHRIPKTITIHHRHAGTTKSRQAPLPVAKVMGKEFLCTHALSLWGLRQRDRHFQQIISVLQSVDFEMLSIGFRGYKLSCPCSAKDTYF